MLKPVTRYRAYLPVPRSYQPGRRSVGRIRPQHVTGQRPPLRFPSACAPEGALLLGPSG